MGTNKRSSCAWARVERLLLLALLMATGGLRAQQSLESNYRLTGPGVLAAFEEQREAIQKSSAVILNGRDEIAYGVVVSPDGYILTKASEISEVPKISVIVDRTKFSDAEVVMVDATWDVALVKVAAEGLAPVVYAPTSEVAQGTWVVVNGASTRVRRRVLAGVVSAKIREVPPAGGAVLGITLKDSAKELEISAVREDSGAEEAGLQVGDLILEADGKKVKQLEELTEAIKGLKAGSMVKLKLKRNGKELEAEVRLSARGELFEEVTRNDMMSGAFSKRRSGFPRVLQHDILGNSSVMGGPVLDLDGRVLGMNIARANRAETFAIPVEDLKQLAEGMMKQARPD